LDNLESLLNEHNKEHQEAKLVSAFKHLQHFPTLFGMMAPNDFRIFCQGRWLNELADASIPVIPPYNPIRIPMML
jgi:hypothetical protein